MPPQSHAPVNPEARLASLKVSRSVLAPQVLSDDVLQSQIDAAAELAKVQNDVRREQLAQIDAAIAATSEPASE